MTTTPRNGRPRTPRPASRVTEIYLYTVRSAILDLQQLHAVSDVDMLQILTRAAADIAIRLPTPPEPTP